MYSGEFSYTPQIFCFRYKLNKPSSSFGFDSLGEPTWSFTQAAVHRVDAGLCFQSAGRRLGQVAAEPGVARLAGQPLQSGVGEGRHVLPAPVRHVDLPEPHPGRHCGLVLRETQRKKQKMYISFSNPTASFHFYSSGLPSFLSDSVLTTKAKQLSPWVNELFSLGCWKLCQKSSDRSSFIGSDINSPGLTEIIKAALLHLTWEPLLSIPSLINGRAVAVVVNKESSISLRRVSNYCSIGI